MIEDRGLERVEIAATELQQLTRLSSAGRVPRLPGDWQKSDEREYLSQTKKERPSDER